MENIYIQKPARIFKNEPENDTVASLYLHLPDQKRFQFRAGQFLMLGLPGYGECPITISSAPGDSVQFIRVTIRAVGELTEKMINLKNGETLLYRGPFGNGFPEVAENLILIAGGCGIAPLMSVFEENKNRKDIRMQFFIGCKTEDTLIYRKNYNQMSKHAELSVSLQQKALLKFNYKKGMVGNALKKRTLLENAKVFICGPEAMYPSIAKILLEKKVQSKDIFMTLEKRMHCGAGVCEHCAIGPKYICKDGPVFSYDFLQQIDKYKIE